MLGRVNDPVDPPCLQDQAPAVSNYNGGERERGEREREGAYPKRQQTKAKQYITNQWAREVLLLLPRVWKTEEETREGDRGGCAERERRGNSADMSQFFNKRSLEARGQARHL